MRMLQYAPGILPLWGQMGTAPSFRMGRRNLPQAAALANSNEKLARQTARTQHVL